MLTLILCRALPLSWVRAGARWLLAEMLLFFVPAVVAVVNYAQLLMVDGWRIFAVIALSTLMVLGATAGWWIKSIALKSAGRSMTNVQISVLCLIATIVIYFANKRLYRRFRALPLMPLVFTPSCWCSCWSSAIFPAELHWGIPLAAVAARPGNYRFCRTRL